MSKKITNEQFIKMIPNSLTPLDAYDGANNRIRFKCATCGDIKERVAATVMYGSGGCRLCDAKSRRKVNIIKNDHGNWVELDLSTKKHPNATMKIDKQDLEHIISSGYGRIIPMESSSTTYAVTKKDGKMNAIHRIILPSADMVDHINHDGLDNRRSNIRSCTHAENMRNRLVQKNNTSGFVGVTLDKCGKWKATITTESDGRKHLGMFVTKEEAIRVRIKAEEKYYKEFMNKEK